MRKIATITVALATMANLARAEVQSPDLRELKAQTARFAPTPITADVGALPPNERLALTKLVQAAKIMDTLFLRQTWAGSYDLMLSLAMDASPLGKARLHAFLVNKGPWTRLDHNVAFIPGVPPKPEGGNFYPHGATRAELDTWFKALAPADRTSATGFFTTVRRATDGKFLYVPYSIEYQGELTQAAQLLYAAARLTAQPTLKKFLEKRAAAFMSNDYYDSDVAWMELDSSIEPTVGPYEVYEDEWFNFKAAFESFIGIRDEGESIKLAKFSDELQDIENHLPIDPKYRNPRLGSLAPIRVVNEVFCSGDANHGVQTAAYNLPNDERVAKEKGTKRVMLKNVQEAKFRVALMPISEIALSSADRRHLAFDAFFTHILLHELMHGLGPHTITVAGKPTTVRQALENSYSAFEEAKADISGLWAMQYLVDKNVIPRSLEESMYVTFLASAFRSIRFGTGEAHGKGQAMQLNYLLDQGAVSVAKDGTFTVDASKIKAAVAGLTHELMTVQAEGNKAKAEEMLKTLGVVRPEVQRVLDRLKKVPVDIEPQFTTADQLLKSNVGK